MISSCMKQRRSAQRRPRRSASSICSALTRPRSSSAFTVGKYLSPRLYFSYGVGLFDPGQVITLRLPASRLREVNRIFETTAWGAYHTEFYPTYDLKSVGLDLHAKAQKARRRAPRPRRE